MSSFRVPASGTTDDGPAAKGASPSPRPRGGGRHRPAWARRQERFGWLMISPSLLVLLAVSTLPIVVLVGMSLFTIEMTTPWQNGWAGLANFAQMMQDERFWHSLTTTLVFTGSTVILQVVIGLALAVALSGPLIGSNFLRVAIMLPMILAPVVVGLTWRTLLLTPEYGLVDFLAQTLGIGSQPWLGDPTLALVSVIGIHTWQWVPFAFLVFLNSLASLPKETIEAALIDRATGWQVFRYVTLPMIRPAIVIVVVIRVMIALRAFDAIFAATGGGPGTATEILNLYAYRTSFNSLSIGYGSALATTLLVITVFLSLIFFRVRESRS